MLYKIASSILFGFLKLTAGDAFANRDFDPRKMLKAFIMQKILRINGHVPWPVHSSSKIIRPERIERGDRCPGLSRGVHLDGRNGIVIGSNTWLGPRVSIISMNHNLTSYREYTHADPVIIGKNCWLGANAVILPGITLGNHVVVGAGSIVTKSFGDDLLIAGNPAKKIKDLPPYKKRL